MNYDELDLYIEKNLIGMGYKNPADVTPRGNLGLSLNKMPRGSMERVHGKDTFSKEALVEKNTSDTLEDEFYSFFNLDLLELANKSHIDYYRLLSIVNKDVLPKKEEVICLGFGLMLDYDSLAKLVSLGGYRLTLTKKADVIVKYFIENENYDLEELNQALNHYHLDLLF